jgi:hypothetical protein
MATAGVISAKYRDSAAGEASNGLAAARTALGSAAARKRYSTSRE